MAEAEKKIDWNLLHLSSDENRKQIESKLEEIQKKRGQIITWNLEIEELLEGILTNYLMRHEPRKERIQFFEIEVMRDMKFENKVQLFKKILKKEEYDNEKSKRLISLIKNVQQWRNKAAHWRIFVFLKKGEVKLRKKEFLENEMISLTDEMLKKLEEDKEFIFQETIRFHQWSWDKEIKEVNESYNKQLGGKNA